MRFPIARSLAAMAAGLTLAGCGSPATPDQPGAGQPRPASGCPFTPESLGQATSLTWELREKRDDHPLETAESIRATVCLYTAADAPQDGSDPLSLRADVVTGADAATVRKNFTDTCTEYGGAIRDAASGKGAVVCDRAGSVVEGLTGGDDRTVNVYLVNADKATAVKLTPAFGRILTAAGRQ